MTKMYDYTAMPNPQRFAIKIGFGDLDADCFHAEIVHLIAATLNGMTVDDGELADAEIAEANNVLNALVKAGVVYWDRDVTASHYDDALS